MAAPAIVATAAQEISNPSRPPHKRVKTAANLMAKPSEQEEVELLDATAVPPPSDTNVDLGSTGILSPELAHLQTKYEFATMSIISSVKMEQKIRVLLSHLARFNYADIHCKPGVVALHAKANVAGKMISIVEIAKREIQNEKGKWWQYSRCHGELMEWKQKAARTAKSGKASVENGNKAGDGEGSTSQQGEGDGMDVDEEDDDEEAAFQTMSPKKVAAQVEARKKVRAVPVMTIYLSRVPIPEFKAIYGEQTNSPKGTT